MNIDRVVILNDNEALIIYQDRPPFKLYALGDIQNFVSWFLTPKIVIRLDEYRRAIALSNVDTSEINLEKAG